MVKKKTGKPAWHYDWVDNGDLKKIRSRMLQDLYDPQADPSACLANLGADGFFKNIDYYTDKKDIWHPSRHLDAILLMQSAAYTPGNPFYGNGELIAGIARAIDFWVEKDFVCTWNGWWNNLGTGPKIADILLFPNDGIPAERIRQLSDKLYRITAFHDSKRRRIKQREVNETGGNLTDQVNHSLKYAVIMGDGEGIKFLRRLMENELRPFPAATLLGHRWDAEGIKADMSFQQHFELLYLGGYGEVFCDGMNRFIRYTAGTQYALSKKSLTFYQDFLLDGMQYAMRGKYRDINASGRGIVRENELVGICAQVFEGCEVLLNSGLALPRADEMRALLETRGENGDIGAGGHRYFWNSDYQVYNDRNYMASVRAASTRTKNSEALNGENVWGHYLGAGATMYYVNGDEYFNILPLWDWNKIPGTTAVQGYLPYGDDRTYSRMGKTAFVGGVSDGKVGMSCLKYRDNGVRAKKAWFMTEDGVMCLGTDISASKKGDLYTTLNQNLLRGDIIYSVNGAVAQTAEMQQTATFDWIYNNGIGYITEVPLTVNAGERTGDWKTVSERVDSKQHTDTVFELGISHGEKPDDASYEYFVMMNTTPEELRHYRETPTVTVLSNTSECQAVYDAKSGNAMAVFWHAGELTLPGGETLRVSSGCTLLCRQTDMGFEIRANDPKQNGGSLKISVGEKAAKIEFPKGMYAGKEQRAAL
ncbi:MAG TPA: hypothetical protein IAB39_10420 [Candidatus Onthovicinus excrementipullorum]|nr:hypothetical protein [Candidatus Onthovicinus excrementipullorum]